MIFIPTNDAWTFLLMSPCRLLFPKALQLISTRNGHHKKCKATMKMKISFPKWKFKAFTGRTKIEELKCCKRFQFKLIACWLVSSGHVDFLMMHVLVETKLFLLRCWSHVCLKQWFTSTDLSNIQRIFLAVMCCDLCPASMYAVVSAVKMLVQIQKLNLKFQWIPNSKSIWLFSGIIWSSKPSTFTQQNLIFH